MGQLAQRVRGWLGSAAMLIASVCCALIVSHCANISRRSSSLDYVSTTNLVTCLSDTAGGHWQSDSLKEKCLERVRVALASAGLDSKRTGNQLKAQQGSGALVDELVVDVSCSEESVMSPFPAAAWVVKVQWLKGNTFQKHPGAGVANAHREAERIRGLVIDALQAKSE